MRHLWGRRCSAAGLVALALSTTLTLSAAAPATAASDGHWWFDAYGIQAIHDEGWTGAGVKIAVIDSNINPDLPVFAGRNLTVDPRPLCAEASSPSSAESSVGAVHGTTVVAQIIGSGQGPDGIRGIAPDADVTFYSMGTQTDEEPCTAAEYGDRLTAVALGVQRALEDGADIITTSVAGGRQPDDPDVIANAIAKGVVVIASGPNPTTRDIAGLREYRGVIVASAVDDQGQLAKLDTGQPLVYPRTTLVAPGVNVATVGRSSKGWDATGIGSGSSFAAPIVAGAMALAEQRSPGATFTQLVQSLLRNTGRDPHELSDDPASGYGYGLAWPANLVREDAAAYPDENLLLRQDNAAPTTAQIEAAEARGSTFPTSSEPASSPTEDARPRSQDDESGAASATNVALIAAAAALGLVIIGAGITAAIVVTSRKRARKGTSDDRSV